MNVINVNIDFETGLCEKTGISVVTGDYNSTKVSFTFNTNDGIKMFEMKNPNNELVYADEIINNEVVLVGKKEENNEEVMFSLFDVEGDYTFEVSLYNDNSKLTSVQGYITARKEQVIIDGEAVERELLLFDNLMNELEGKIDEVDNLNIEASKVDDTTTITITKKDGTQQETLVEDGIDGQDGVSLENMVIDNRDLKVTYGGETDNLGQVVPNIQVGTTTTVLPSANARVINVGTDLNPILNFEIPKGDAGAIKIRIVNELPLTGDEDTFYLVPKQESETQDMYDEYVWINNTWELVGEKQIEVDLSDYYTKQEVNALIPDELSDLADDSTHRLVTDTEKTTWNNKIDSSALNGYVKNTDYATNNVGGVIKTDESYGTKMYNGIFVAETRTYEQYTNAGNGCVIGKRTLENVITGKGLVSNTDYATSSTGGVIKVSSASLTDINSNGIIIANKETYANYQNASDRAFISKGTLENVITGKDLTTKSYVDGLVGDINSALDTINGEVI